MTWSQAFLLGIIEGITEFLPISSTGHMVIASHFMGIAGDPFTKAFEVIIQMGAILTVLVLYWRRFLPNWSFYQKILVAFLPTAVIGFFLKNQVDRWLESPLVVAWALVLGGVVLLFIDRWNKAAAGKNIEDLNLPACVKLGLFQSLAMIPGVSRSGATIVGGMLLGMKRAEAAEFSFFLAVPTMAAATGYKLLKMIRGGESFTGEQWQLLGVGFIVSFIVAAVAIKAFIGFLQKKGFALFGWYRIIVGIILLILLAQGTDLNL
ncbi:MAG: undecaprenyl-diphosphate phosphatase [Bdellovibrionaceae bacterium]|nr:undecaprenyl-diphosphate phosphatase [Pseudobdellovibrionaceae bacterium]